MRDLALNNVHLAPLNLDKFDRTEIIKNTIRECMNKLINANLLERRSVVRKKDTIDISEYGKENCGGNLSALPSMEFKDEEKEALSKNWTLAVPPLLEGVVLINKDRYLVYSTSDLDIDEKKYKVFIYDYAYLYWSTSEEITILCIPIKQAWGFETDEWLDIANKYDIDIRLYGVESGMGFWQEIEIGCMEYGKKREVITNLISSYSDYDEFLWECPMPLLGG